MGNPTESLKEYLLVISAGLFETLFPSKSKRKLLSIIWELYWNNPDKYLRMFTMIMTTDNSLSWAAMLQQEFNVTENALEDSIFNKMPNVQQFLQNQTGVSESSAKQLCQDATERMNDKLFKF